MRLVIFKPVELGLNRAAVDETNRAHIKTAPEGEVAELIFIENFRKPREYFASFMQAIINWVFEESGHVRTD